MEGTLTSTIYPATIGGSRVHVAAVRYKTDTTLREV